MDEKLYQTARYIQEMLADETNNALNMQLVIAELSDQERQFLEEFAQRCRANRQGTQYEFGVRTTEVV